VQAEPRGGGEKNILDYAVTESYPSNLRGGKRGDTMLRIEIPVCEVKRGENHRGIENLKEEKDIVAVICKVGK